jgi:hypothetical protein
VDIAEHRSYSMANLFDKLNKELEDFGKKAQSAFDEGRVRLDLMRLRRKQENTARDLGLLYHQTERGGEGDQEQIDAMLTRLDGLKVEITELEEQIRNARASATVDEEPAPEADTAEAEIVEEAEIEEVEVEEPAQPAAAKKGKKSD